MKDNAKTTPLATEFLWELFHENSKISRYDTLAEAPVGQWKAKPLSPSTIRSQDRLVQLPNLPPRNSTEGVLDSASGRHDSVANEITVNHTSAILSSISDLLKMKAAHLPGQDQDQAPASALSNGFGLFVHCLHVSGIRAGLYEYNPLVHQLYLLSLGGYSEKLAAALFRSTTAGPPELLLFLTARLSPRDLPHGNRDYRITLITAGCIAQRIADEAHRNELDAIGIAYYCDRDVDEYLSLDGFGQSTVLIIGVTCKGF